VKRAEPSRRAQPHHPGTSQRRPRRRIGLLLLEHGVHDELPKKKRPATRNRSVSPASFATPISAPIRAMAGRSFRYRLRSPRDSVCRVDGRRMARLLHHRLRLAVNSSMSFTHASRPSLTICASVKEARTIGRVWDQLKTPALGRLLLTGSLRDHPRELPHHPRVQRAHRSRCNLTAASTGTRPRGPDALDRRRLGGSARD